MKKNLFALSLVALFSTVAQAQKLTVLPDESNFGFMGEAISPNGRYVSGAYASGMFLADLTTGKITRFYSSDEEGEGSSLLSVSNDGLAVGYDYQPVTFDINGNRTELNNGEGFAEQITPDGKYIVGTLYENYSYLRPQVWVKGDNGYEQTSLAEPRSEFLGYEIQGSTSRGISADGSLIIGYIQVKSAAQPALAWYLNRDETTYSTYPFSHRFFEPANGSKPYKQFTPTGISSNGKWIALYLTDAKTGESKIARYDVDKDSLEVAKFTTQATADEYYMTTKIADDGTLLYIDILGRYKRKAGIWKAGIERPQLLSEAFPDVSQLKVYDEKLYGLASDITPDGRYIVGYATNAENKSDTFILDTMSDQSSVSGTKDDDKSADGKISRYSIDGSRVGNPVNGVNIEVSKQGTVRKVVVTK